MSNNRLPKICLLRLVHLHCHTNMDTEFNWVTQFASHLEKVGLNHLWESPYSASWQQNTKLAFERYDRYLKFQDVLRCSSSTVMNCNILRSLDDREAPYLSYRSHFFMIKLLSQIRLSTNYNLRFCIKGTIYKINQSSQCSICNHHTNETLQHIFFDCPAYFAIRASFLGPLITIYNNNLNYIVNTNCLSEIKNIYYFIVNTLRLRSFFLNE